jgi:serine/threonine-protein phosphatase 5
MQTNSQSHDMTDDNSAVSRKEKGNKHFYNKNYDAAIKCYNEAMLLNTNFKETFLNIGRCYIKLQRYDEALIVLNKAIQMDACYTKAVLIKIVILKNKN